MRLLITCFALFFSVSLMAQVPPIQGDDLMTALGQRKSTFSSRELLTFVGANGNPKGIKINFVNNKLARIELYNDDNPWGADIRRFRGGLPKNISFDDDIKTTKQKLGNGFEVSGDVETMYYVTKNYQMSTGDTCQLNAEFSKGRMINFALIFYPGSGEVGEDGNKYVLPITGWDYLTMVKKNTYNKQLNTLLSLVGSPTFKNRTTLVYSEAGVEILFNKYQQVDWLNFYSSGTSEVGSQSMKKCELPLPMEVKFGDTRSNVTSRLGEPASTDGNKLIYNVEYARVYITVSGSGVSFVQVGVNEDFSIENRKADRPSSK